jgi:uncharacterized protein
LYQQRLLIAEYKEVLKRPRLKLTEAQYERWVYLIDSVTTLIDVNVEVDFPRDRKDAKFLACAITAGADFFLRVMLILMKRKLC